MIVFFNEATYLVMVVTVAAEQMEMAAIQIRADYDEDAHVWVAQSDEIPLVTEAATFEILCQKLPSLIQDVLGENGDARVGQDVAFELITQSHSLPRAKVA